MDIIMYKKALDYLSGLYGSRESLRVLPKKYKKPASPVHSPVLYPFERAAPESVGMRTEKILAFLDELLAMPELHPHLLMIAKDDKIICECEFYPYRADIWHIGHSLCKSITGLAVGLLVDDGILSLDDKITDLFAKRAFSIDFARQKDITIRHLLTMSAGVAFNELGSVTYEDWAEGFFSAGVKFSPGTQFMYNSMNSYLLAAILCRVTGQSLVDYLTPRLFEPLGVPPVYWETCPMGIEKGGWGIYLREVDMA